MENESNVCRLCLRVCQDFEMIKDSYQEIINTLLLYINLAISHAPVVCKTCIESLQNCFSYKIVSLNIHDLSSVKGCLFCDKWTISDRFVLLTSRELDVMLLKAMIDQFFPELEFMYTLYPVICIRCYKNLQKNFDFIVRCLNVEQQIKNYCTWVGIRSQDRIDLRELIHFQSPGIKLENDCCIESTKMSKDINTSVFYSSIKEENKENIVECTIDDDWKSNMDRKVQNRTDPYLRYSYDKCEVNILCEEVKLEDCDIDEGVDLACDIIEADIENKESLCSKETADEGVQREGANKINSDFECSKNHELSQRYPSDVTRYECCICGYTTHSVDYLNAHVSKHPANSQKVGGVIYKCVNLSFHTDARKKSQSGQLQMPEYKSSRKMKVSGYMKVCTKLIQ